MRKLKLFFACLLMTFLSIGQMWGAESSVTISPSQALNDGGVSPISIACAKGDGSSNPAISSGQLRLYQAASGKTTGNTITFSSTATITKIEFDFVSGKTASNGSFSAGSYDDATTTWTGSATSLTLTVTGTTSGTRIYINSMKVYFDGGTPSPDPDPEPDPEPQTGDSYELVTSLSELADGNEIIIVNVDEDKAVGGQNSSNRAGVAISATNHIITPGDDVQIIILEASSSNWKFKVGEDSYLYASSNSSNQLKSAKATTAGDNGVWAITIASDGTATAIAQGANGRNELRYNPNNGSPIFSCYASTSTLDVVKIYKKSDGKQETGLSYAEADRKNLVKPGETFTAPTLVNSNNLSGITYASSNTAVAEVEASTGAITINAVGVAEISATFAGNDTYKAGSASYTIGVTAHAGTQADPYTVADAKIVIDAIETEENVHVAGKVSQIVTAFNSTYGNISFNISEDGTTANQLEAFRCKSFGGAAFTSENDVETGATVVVKGILKKYNSKYELDENCCLVTYEAPAAPKTPIANTQETAYSVAQALVYAADGLTYDLNDEVFVQGKVAVASNNLYSDKYLTYFISDNGVNENTLKIYNGLDINGASFTSKDDVKVGDIVIVKGKLLEYNSVLELNQNNELVLHKPVATISVENMEIAVGDEPKAIVAEIIPAMAADHVVYSIAEGGDAFISIDAENKISAIAEGVATVNVTLADGDTYAGTNASFTVTVNAAAAPVLTDYYEKVTETAGIVEGTYLIVYEEGSLAFNGGLETLDAKNNVIDVEITNDNKIGVTTATEAATFYIEPAAGTIQAVNGKYIGVTSNSNGLKQSDNADAYENAFEIDADGNAVISAVFENANMTMRYNKASDQNRFRYFGSSQQPIALYKLANETVKPEAGLTWDPAEDITLTVGDAFTAPTLLNPNSIDAAEITIASSNPAVATVTAGVVELVEDATGTTTITATFAGNASYKPATVSYKIKVNPANSIYVSPSLTVNFGSVAKDATVDDKVITVTLTGVDAATATLEGAGASAFEFTPATLTASGDITISASSATAGTFAATLTISDDAGVAASKVVNLSLTVTDPAAEETPISTSTEWIAATATDLVDGAEVIITGVKDEVVYAMGEQKSTNRAAYVATLNEGVLTPGEGTMAFTLVAQGDGTYALRTSNGKYLYAAASGSNHLKTQDEVDVNAQWTLAINSAVAESSTNRNIMRFNGSGDNKLFSCYSSGQTAIQFYVPKPVTPPTPVYETVREGLTAGNYYTICYPKAMTDVQGATLWSFVGRDANLAYIQQETAATIEAGKPYILYAEAATVTAILGTENASAGVNGAIHGTLEKMFQADLNTAATAAGHDLYLVIGNELRRATGDGTGSNTLPAYRAFVVVNDIPNGAPTQAPGKKVRSMPHHKDTTTGVENAEASEKPVKLLINGQIFILRGEKMYDATGRLVK